MIVVIKKLWGCKVNKNQLMKTCILPEFFNIILRERGMTLYRAFFTSVYKFLVIFRFVFGPAVRETSFCLFQRQQRSY